MAAPAALPPFPPGHIPFDELVPGIIYKRLLITPVNYGWGFGRFIRRENRLGINVSRYGSWKRNPNQAQAPLYMEFIMSENYMKFYPLKFETGAIPRLPNDENPPPAELVGQITNTSEERRAHALAAWSKAQPSNSNTRRRSNRRRSSRRHRPSSRHHNLRK